MVQQKPSGSTSQVTRVPRAEQANIGASSQLSGQKRASESSESPESPEASVASDGPLPLLPMPLPTFARELRCQSPLCSLASVVPMREFVKAAHSDALPNAALWIYHIAENSTLLFPENHAVELYALVLKGSLAASSVRAETANLKLWSLVQADGAGLSLSAITDAALAIAVVAKTGPLAQAVAESNRLRAPPRQRATMTVLELPAIPPASWGQHRFSAQLAFGGEVELPSVASFGILRADKDAPIRPNVHENEWEHLIVIAGDGSLTLDQEVYPVRPGSILQIEPGATHSFTPSGKAPLFAIQLFAAKGPERRYLDLARAEQAGKK